MIHSHNLRSVNDDIFTDKWTLIVGARWTGLDLLYHLLELRNKEGKGLLSRFIVNTAEPDYISQSKNFEDNLNDGVLTVKKGKKITFNQWTATFEDWSEAEIDNVVLWTGYKYSFPFLHDSSLIEVSENGRYWGPLFHKIFCINDPTLMFAGNSDNNSFIQVVMEKQIIVIKHFIEGRITLPSKEDMKKILDTEVESFAEIGLRNYFKGFNHTQLNYMKSLQNLLIENKIEVTQMNEKFFTTLKSMIKIFSETIVAGNFADFKTYDYNTWVAPDFEYDTTKYF